MVWVGLIPRASPQQFSSSAKLMNIKQHQIQLYISQLRKDRETLSNEKNRLENDFKYIEKLAREKYRMAKPGEKVFKVLPKGKGSKR